MLGKKTINSVKNLSMGRGNAALDASAHGKARRASFILADNPNPLAMH
jgi:hypothetical protein